jgi:hypothetical protein
LNNLKNNNLKSFEGNPDVPAWRRYFFEVSEGKMQMKFSMLESHFKETGYKTVSLLN